MAGNVLAGEVPAGSPHATQDLAGDGPVHTHALHHRCEDVVQLWRPLHLHAPSYRFRKGLKLALAASACSQSHSSVASHSVVRSVAQWKGHVPEIFSSLSQGRIGAIDKLTVRSTLCFLQRASSIRSLGRLVSQLVPRDSSPKSSLLRLPYRRPAIECGTVCCSQARGEKHCNRCSSI